MTEPTRRWITQIVVPAIILFGGLAVMHGPAYFNYFQRQWLDYRLARDSVFGTEQVDVRLKAGFVGHSGKNCLVVVLTDKDEQGQTDDESRHEVILVDSLSRVVQRDLHDGVGPIHSTHLSPQDGGFAVLEIVRRIPENRRLTEVTRYQVTEERIAAMGSEVRQLNPERERTRRRGWRGRDRRDDSRNAWSRHRDGDADRAWKDRSREDPRIDRPAADQDEERARRNRGERPERDADLARAAAKDWSAKISSGS